MGYVLHFERHETRLAPGESIVGRDRTSHVCIEDPSVSRRHARMLVVQDVVTIEDLGSKNGVRVNGKRVRGTTRLGDGDRVRCGEREFTLRWAVEGTKDTQTPTEFVEYRAPIYRTCTTCHGLVSASDRACAACGAEQVDESYPTRRAWTDPEGRRTFFRKSVSFRALYVSETNTVEGEITDLSPRGGFFVTRAQDSVGTPCDLLVSLEWDDDPLRIPAEVARTAIEGGQERGLGLRFVRVSAEVQVWLMSVTDPPDQEGDLTEVDARPGGASSASEAGEDPDFS